MTFPPRKSAAQSVIRCILLIDRLSPARFSVQFQPAMSFVEKPMESNDTPQGRSKNRRVVIRLVPGKPG